MVCQVANHREPVAVVGLRVRPPVDATVIALDHDTVGGDVHVTRVGVRRAAADCAAASRPERVRVGEVHELAARRLRRVTAERLARRNRSRQSNSGMVIS